MLNQPVSQVKLTNVAIIKYKIACYKNKAINWRNGVEKDIEEVLQIDGIFTNVQQGNLAKKKDLVKIFGTSDKNTIIKQILAHGQLQVSDKERDVQSENIFKEIVNIISEKAVHQISKRPLSNEAISQAIKDFKFRIKLDQTPKKQALSILKAMKKKYLVARADMKLRVVVPLEENDKLLDELKILKHTELSISKNEEKMSYDILIKPSKYRRIDKFMKIKIQGGLMEILDPHFANRETIRLDDALNINLELRDVEIDPYISSSDSESEAILEGVENIDGALVKTEEEKSNQSITKKLSKTKKERRHEKEQREGEKAKFDQGKLEEEEKKIEEEIKIILNDSEIANMKYKCNACFIGFEDNAEFKKHWKSDWHVFNMKLKNEKKKPISEKDYHLQVLEAELERTL